MQRALVLAGALLVGCFNPRIQNGGFACNGTDATSCPAGFACAGGKCVMTASGGAGGSGGGVVVSVPKTARYDGLRLDPKLQTTMDCPDEPLEPNDGPGAPPFGPPILVSPVVDVPTPRVKAMSICPMGNNPATGLHDSDWFKLTLDAPATLVAEAFYDVAYGDLDLAIVDRDGMILASDGSAVSNACAARQLDAGTYYVVVVGADNTGVNRYELGVRLSSSAAACGAAGDMAAAAHD